jgi:hypothetical protein
MKASVSEPPSSEARVEYFKIDNGQILVRITRGTKVVEATISTVPPEETQMDSSAADLPAAGVSG